MTEGSLTGRARFRLLHAGSAGVAHGGAVAFLMDEVMGVLANSEIDDMARTATISIDYKRPRPVGVELLIKARLRTSDPRKHWVAGTLESSDGSALVTARALFVTPAPAK